MNLNVLMLTFLLSEACQYNAAGHCVHLPTLRMWNVSQLLHWFLYTGWIEAHSA